ncbi:PHP domain-containing protein [Anoxybacterium hadale]|uniref:PHP domain-containing protein n=1 Tax=Anoxybacterium hadale TaxID=3408580 RepID=A0ACD1AH74_9FIRM|nr:PHP domain-containing protein [Clostridiales bacterium]
MADKFIDLHMHSYYSDDGEFSPAELVRRSSEQGITIMAISDHNSIRAVEEAKKEAEKYHIHYINAIEIDCTYRGIDLHVLGYGIDDKNKEFGDLEENILRQERACAAMKLELTNRLGFDVKQEQLDELSKEGVYTGELFAEILFNDPRYQEHKLLQPYRAGGSRSDNPYVNFYWDFYTQGKACYTEILYPSLEEVVKLIDESGGVAVLAHPGNNLKGKFELFDELIASGLQGVEAFSNYHDDEAAKYFLNKGREYNLLVTCGSDFHGKIKPAIEIGETGCTIDQKEIQKELQKRGLIRG